MTTDWRSVLEARIDSAALWDEGVEAARNACVAGAPLAAAAITAAAYYDNPLTGGRALLAAFERFAALPLQLGAWQAALATRPRTDPSAAGEPDPAPGFGFVAPAAEAAVLALAQELCTLTRGARLGFFCEHSSAIRAAAGPLNLSGLCALVFVDASLTAEEAERRYLLLRLGPALAAAQRSRRAGLARFPFFADGYHYDGAWPTERIPEPCSDEELAQLKREVGIE